MSSFTNDIVNGTVYGDGGSGTVNVDSSLSTTSENPVQNKVIKAALDLKANASDIPSAVVVDSSLSTTSENPVQNKVIKAALDLKADAVVVETVSGTSVSITAYDNHRYVCSGTVTQISFTPCSSGLCEVIFTTGNNPVWDGTTGAVMPEWFSIEAGRIYEMSFLNRLGAVISWPTT